MLNIANIYTRDLPRLPRLQVLVLEPHGRKTPGLSGARKSWFSEDEAMARGKAAERWRSAIPRRAVEKASANPQSENLGWLSQILNLQGWNS